MQEEIKKALNNINKTQTESVMELIESKLEEQKTNINRLWIVCVFVIDLITFAIIHTIK